MSFFIPLSLALAVPTSASESASASGSTPATISVVTYTPPTPSSFSFSSNSSSQNTTHPSSSSNSNSTQAQTRPGSENQDPSQTLTTHALFFFLAVLAVVWVWNLPRGVGAFLGRGRSRRGWWGLGGFGLGYDEGCGDGDGDGRWQKGYGEREGGEKYGYGYGYPPPPPVNVPRDVGEGEGDGDGDGEGEGEGERYGYGEGREYDDEKGDEKEERGEVGNEMEMEGDGTTGGGGGYPRKMERRAHLVVGRSGSGGRSRSHSKRGGGGHRTHRRQQQHQQQHRYPNRKAQLRIPPHVPAYPSFLRALAVPMRMRFPEFVWATFGFLFSCFSSSSSSSSSPSPTGTSTPNTRGRARAIGTGTGTGYTLGQTLVLTLYTLPLLYVTFARGSNPLSDPVRTGFVGLVQVPIAVGLAGKNGVLGFVMGLGGGVLNGRGGIGLGGGGNWGYEKVNWLHRWVARGVVLGVNAHCWHYFYLWTFSGTFGRNISAPSNMWGLVGLVAVDVMFVFSLEGVRERVYGFFLGSHVLGLVVLLPAIYMHKRVLMIYVLAASGLYVLDHLLRLAKTRVTDARLVALPGLDMTRIEIPRLNRGWRAGQHVRVHVVDPDAGVLGRMGWVLGREVHALTIASAEGSGQGMVLMCKRVGDWSGRVYDVARGGRYNMNAEAGKEAGRQARVVVEGPYGGVGNTNVASFSAAVYVCGGSGITFALAGISELVERDLRGESRVKLIQLVWVVPDPGCLEPLLVTFTRLIHRSVCTPLRISVFYTRAPTGKQPAYFDAVDASPFAPAPAAAPGNVHFHTSPTEVHTDSTPKHQHQRHPSHTLVSPVSEDTEAFALAYQQRLEKQRTARPRPPPSQRPAEPYEAPRPAPAPPPPSAYTAPKTKPKTHTQSKSTAGPGPGPQRQDSNASARTLVDPSSYPRKSSLKRTLTHPHPHPAISSAAAAAANQPLLPTNLTLAPGRPRLSHFLQHALDSALRLPHSDLRDIDEYEYEYDYHGGDPLHRRPTRVGKGGGEVGQGNGKAGAKLCGMVVLVCGPPGLAEEVCGAVAGLEWERTQRAGGVEVVEEVFGC